MRIVALLFISLSASAQLRVAVIDSGFDENLSNAPMCRPPITDQTHYKHGTNVIDLIYKNAGEGNYCIDSYNIMVPEFDFLVYYAVLKNLVKTKPDILNLSLAGHNPDETETKLLKTLLDEGVTIIAAAGNTKDELSEYTCNVYPACADYRIVVIGNYDTDSGHGSKVSIVTHKDKGCVGEYCLYGTSQSTAIETGRFIRFLLEHE